MLLSPCRGFISGSEGNLSSERVFVGRECLLGQVHKLMSGHSYGHESINLQVSQVSDRNKSMVR